MSSRAAVGVGARGDAAARRSPALAAKRAHQQLGRRATARSSPPAEVERLDRRAVLGLGALLGASATVRPADAAYGDSARVFAGKTKSGDFTSFVGDKYKVEIPSKWNPDGSVVDGSDLRYADNMRDDGANMDVIVTKAEHSSIEEYGSLEKFLPKVAYLLGAQSFDGATDSEGGFASGRVAAGSIIEQDVVKDGKGKAYNFFHILTRTADGEGGGRHHLLVSTVSDGKLYTLQVQTLDKQWFKGQDKVCQTVAKSFVVS